MSVSAAGLRAVTLGEWLAIFRVTATLVVIELGLRTLRLSALGSLVGCTLDPGESDLRRRTQPGAAPLDYSVTERRQLAMAAKVMRHWLFPPTCLRRALLTGHILRRREPRLRLGVAKSGEVVSAHAWLLVEGVELDFRPEFRGLAAPGHPVAS